MKSRLCAVISDIHFPAHHRGAWASFVEWCRDWRPDEVVVNGDVVDLEALSRYAKSASTPRDVIAEVKAAARELSQLAKLVGIVTVVEGNHDERWSRIVGEFAQNLDGAIGLTLEEQMRFQGLDARVRWVREDVHTKGTTLGPFRVRHGHKQASRFGVKHIAANLLTKPRSQIVGHHHRAQLMCKTAEGIQIMAIANPHLSGDHEYAADPDWQRGFTVVECFGEHATAYPIVMTIDGRFAWGGRVYDGTRRQQPAETADSPSHVGEELDVDLMAKTGEVSTVPETAPVAGLVVSVGGLDYDDVQDTSATTEPMSRRAMARAAGVAITTLRDWEIRTGRHWREWGKL